MERAERVKEAGACPKGETTKKCLVEEIEKRKED